MQKLKKLKWFTLGIAVCLIISAVIIPAVASSGEVQATLAYRDVKINLNGTQLTPKDVSGAVIEPFIIDGTTYLPVRAVSDALGLNVEWDDATSTVKLSTPGLLNGTQICDDNYVTVKFVKMEKYEYTDCEGYTYIDYDMVFSVVNKTEYELTFDCNVMAINGISYDVYGWSVVAPKSTGLIYFSIYDDGGYPISGVTKLSGQIYARDYDEDYYYDFTHTIKFINVTV